MNLRLLACRPPEAFKVGVTVPLAKSVEAAGPSEYRPITMATMICRLFHRLLAHRAGRHLPLGARQKAFRGGDGLADNVWILRSIIDDCKARHRPLCVTFVDVRKAFDTVPHESVVKAAERIGFPPGLVSYIRCLYTGGVTQFRVGRCVGLSSALWKNGGSDPDAVWHHRLDGSRNDAGGGVWGSVHGMGYFWGRIWGAPL